jgi:hypothetical protein
LIAVKLSKKKLEYSVKNLKSITELDFIKLDKTRIKIKKVINNIFTLNLFISRFIGNIIITKRNNTATAPTYIIINIRPKKSILNINNKIAALQKTRIKKTTEEIALFENATKNPQKQVKMQNIKCNVCSIKFIYIIISK